MRLFIAVLMFSAVHIAPTFAEPFAYVANNDTDNVSVILTSGNSVLDTLDLAPTGQTPMSIAITTSPDVKIGTSQPFTTLKSSCAIAGPGAASSYLPLLLFIPALILIRRLWRR